MRISHTDFSCHGVKIKFLISRGQWWESLTSHFVIQHLYPHFFTFTFNKKWILGKLQRVTSPCRFGRSKQAWSKRHLCLDLQQTPGSCAVWFQPFPDVMPGLYSHAVVKYEAYICVKLHNTHLKKGLLQWIIKQIKHPELPVDFSAVVLLLLKLWIISCY